MKDARAGSPILSAVAVLWLISGTAAAPPLNSVERYPVAAGAGDVSAPFCDSGGPVRVSVWSIDAVVGRSGRGGGGIYVSRQTAVKAASVLDAGGAVVATIPINANAGTISATLAAGCYSVHISTVGKGTAGGMVGVRVAPVTPAAPQAPVSPRGAPREDDS